MWYREMFGEHAMQCKDPFYREHEQVLRWHLHRQTIGDDAICEPWFTQQACLLQNEGKLWGVEEDHLHSGINGGANKFLPPLRTWQDRSKLTPLHHHVDEAETARRVERLQEAIGDILPINVDRGCVYAGMSADISMALGYLRGMEQIMEDMYEAPEQLHRLLAFMRDAILSCQQEAEDAGAYSLTTQQNQSMLYCDELPAPLPNTPCTRKQLWTFFAAQEFTLVSPAMHEEFLLQYQLPIMAQWGLVAYGCCEDLTKKISMLRQVPNLRQIAVTPVAILARCAEQIQGQYVFSWRPNPTDMVCCGFAEDAIRGIIREGLIITKDCRVHLHLKDVETVEGDPGRLARWVAIVREEIEKM